MKRTETNQSQIMFLNNRQQLETLLRHGDSAHNFAQVMEKYPPIYAVDAVADTTVSTRFSVLGNIQTFVISAEQNLRK